MGRYAARLVALVITVALIVGVGGILGLVHSGYFPWLAKIIGGALAIAVFLLVLAKTGGDGGE